uniref:Uncharacterized protein n=1 Tax=Strix occidentalis caurina TaxID=311401 RepID=A0A8D0G323_STROC
MRLKRKERENGKGTRENGMKRAVLLRTFPQIGFVHLGPDERICHMLGDTNEESQLQQKTLKQTLFVLPSRDDTTPVRGEPMEADSIAFKLVSEKEKKEKD